MTRSENNTTGRQRSANGLERPSTHEEVVEIVKAARREGQALYPFSLGRNWGYGSRSPVVDGCTLVDLSSMNRILNATEISEDNPVAVLEPGVTQGQLHDFLQTHCPSLTFNVTGAGRDTSILGNSLDRGVGYFGPRAADLFGLEVVTGTGEVLKTGFRRLGEESPLAHQHPYGLGPMLDGLFFQGNFGIVTSACFRLTPRRPCEAVLSLALRDGNRLGEFINALARLKREGLLTSVTHIGNQARTHSTLMYGITDYLETRCGQNQEQAMREAMDALKLVAPNEWTSLAAVVGNKGQVKAAVREIRRRMKGLARTMVVTETLLNNGYWITDQLRFISAARRNAAAISAIRPLHRLALGEPTDVAIENLLWQFDQTYLPAAALDESRVGLLFVSPALPMRGAFVQQLIAELNSIAANFGHTLYTTINIETPTSLVAIINLLFDRTDDSAVSRAHECAQALLACIVSHGLEPYRARVDMMPELFSPRSSYWQTVRELKQVLDPDNIIAPGRYNLP